MKTQINIFKLVSKEVFALEKDGKETLWMVSGFDDEKAEDVSWNNIYDYLIVSTTGEFVPYFKTGENVVTVDYYGNQKPVLSLEALHEKMEAEGFVWKY